MTRTAPPDFLSLEAKRLAAAFAKALEATTRTPAIKLARRTQQMLQVDRTNARNEMLAAQAAALGERATTEQQKAYAAACTKFEDLGQKTNAARAALKSRIVDQQPSVFSEVLPLVESAKVTAHGLIDSLERVLQPMVDAASTMRADGYELPRALESAGLAVVHLRRVRAILSGAQS